jgi:hypothetical protein
MGYGYAVGADTYNPLPNATILLKFPLTRTERPIGPVVHFNKRGYCRGQSRGPRKCARRGCGIAVCLRQPRQPRARHGG